MSDQSSHKPPQTSPASDLDERTRALCELRVKMVELYSQLEYLKLMLKLGVR
jgi:hypothetical protein